MNNENTTPASTVRIGATASQVAERFHVAEKSIRRWAQSGLIPAYRTGRVWRFDLDLVEESLSARHAA